MITRADLFPLRAYSCDFAEGFSFFKGERSMDASKNKNMQSDSIQKHKDFLFPAVTMYYQEPIALERGEGMYVWDDQGTKYLDCFGGVLTTSVGHAHPHVTEAVIDQVKK